MVTITGYKTKIATDGHRNVYLQVEGGLKTVISKNTGRAYLSTLKAQVFAAIDEEIAKGMVGYQLPGSIRQLKVDPYELVDEGTGEVRVYEHRNEYVVDEVES